MADKKISQLSGATTPLTGTEELAIVQGGSTVKATAQDVADLAGAPYKSYVAIIGQSGTNPPSVSAVLQNTIGTITVSYDSVGTYVFSSPGFGGFSGANKVVVFITGTDNFNSGVIAEAAYVPPLGGVRIVTKDLSGTNGNGILNKSNIEIRLYP